MAERAAHPPITDPAAARALFGGLAAERCEVAALAYLDPQWRLLGLRHVRGARDRLAVPLRLIAQDALAFGATGIVVAHNHPSGDARPSAGDVACSRVIARALAPLGIALLDHVVVSATGSTSLREAGLL